MMLTQPILEFVRACFSGLWIESHEHDDAIAELASLCRDQQWQLAVWDIDQGLQSVTGPSIAPAASDPLSAVRSLSTLATPDGTTLLVLKNFHRFLGSPEIIQATHRAVMEGKTQRTIVIILAPLVRLPDELDKLFVVVTHPRPERAQLESIARGVATETGELPPGQVLETVLDAAAGLTRLEAENAFALSLVRHERLESSAIWEIKTQTLKKSGLLHATVSIFCRQTLARDAME